MIFNGLIQAPHSSIISFQLEIFLEMDYGIRRREVGIFMIRAWVLLTCHPTSQFIFLSQSYSMAQMLILDSIFNWYNIIPFNLQSNLFILCLWTRVQLRDYSGFNTNTKNGYLFSISKRRIKCYRPVSSLNIES